MMRHLFRNFSRKHLYIFLGFYFGFAAFTLFILSRQSASDWRENWNLAAAVGSFSGPFTGAIARGFQSCCWRFSVGVFPYCGALLLAGFVFQFVPIPWVSGERWLRLMAWSIGLLGWFAGGLVSFGHALS
jgi:hypothetical protein